MRRRQWLHAAGTLVGTTALGGLGACRPAAQEPAVRCPGGDADARPPVLPSSGVGSKSPWAALEGFCDGIEPADDSERGAHRQRMQKALTNAGHDLLIVEAGPTMQFLTGVRWGRSERPFLLAMPRQGAPWWVVPAFEQRTAAEQLGDATVIAWHEHESPYAAVQRALAQGGLEGGTVVADPQLRSFIVEGLRSALGAKRVRSGADVVEAVRMRKQPAELARLRRANEATKAALQQVAQDSIVAGVRQSELAEKVRAAQRAAGLTDIWVLALFGPNASFPHGTAEDRALQPGDAVLIDTGGSLHGYRSDITRTWLLGEPSEPLRAAWRTVAQAQQAALDVIRPGVRCGDVDAAARSVIDAAGYGPDYRLFTHRLGHGIGLEVHEAPYLVRDSERVLEPGMTMSNEPGIYMPGQFGVRIEDIVAVVDGGVEVFGDGVGADADAWIIG